MHLVELAPTWPSSLAFPLTLQSVLCLVIRCQDDTVACKLFLRLYELVGQHSLTTFKRVQETSKDFLGTFLSNFVRYQSKESLPCRFFLDLFLYHLMSTPSEVPIPILDSLIRSLSKFHPLMVDSLLGMRFVTQLIRRGGSSAHATSALVFLLLAPDEGYSPGVVAPKVQDFVQRMQPTYPNLLQDAVLQCFQGRSAVSVPSLLTTISSLTEVCPGPLLPQNFISVLTDVLRKHPLPTLRALTDDRIIQLDQSAYILLTSA